MPTAFGFLRRIAKGTSGYPTAFTNLAGGGDGRELGVTVEDEEEIRGCMGLQVYIAGFYRPAGLSPPRRKALPSGKGDGSYAVFPTYCLTA